MIKRTFSRMAAIAAILSIACNLSFAQTSNIHFENAMTWEELQAKAAKEHKYIFMDCYASWCGPCKYMADSVFTQPAVADFFNKTFINVKVQIDRTKDDNDEVKKGYGLAHLIWKSFGVNSFPTYLFFNPDSKLVHRIIGSSSGRDFINKAKMALDSGTQYYTMIAKAKDHQQDSAYLAGVIKKAFALSDNTTACHLAEYYLTSIKNPMLPVNRSLLPYNSTSSPVFLYFLNHTQGYDDGIENAIIQYELDPMCKSTTEEPDWAKLQKMMQDKYPLYADRVLLKEQIAYYQSTNPDKDKFGKYLVSYMDKYGREASAFECNNNAWATFTMCTDQTILTNALGWSKRAIANYPNVDWQFVDTYANLLYKLGKTNEAIDWEKKAIDLAKIPRQKQAFEVELAKMEKHLPTWN